VYKDGTVIHRDEDLSTGLSTEQVFYEQVFVPFEAKSEQVFDEQVFGVQVFYSVSREGESRNFLGIL